MFVGGQSTESVFIVSLVNGVVVTAISHQKKLLKVFDWSCSLEYLLAAGCVLVRLEKIFHRPVYLSIILLYYFINIFLNIIIYF